MARNKNAEFFRSAFTAEEWAEYREANPDTGQRVERETNKGSSSKAAGMSCGYQCFEIGGPWISENPDCPFHGTEAKAREAQALAQEDKIRVLERQLDVVTQMVLKQGDRIAALEQTLKKLKRSL